jgi:predicted DsbA family dithiol-disulfide isomerase
MHDGVYRMGTPIDTAALEAQGSTIGLDMERFRDDLMSSRYARVVAQHVATAERSGVAGTPTYFINDIRYHGPHDVTSLESALRATRRTERIRGLPEPA